MSRIPWDDLPSAAWNQKLNEQDESRRLKLQPVLSESATNEPEIKERNYMHELDSIGRRFAFGLVCGGLTGATFGY
jgi:hypothetical protein